MKNMKRLLAMLLATAMVLCLFSVAAFATDEGDTQPPAESPTTTDGGSGDGGSNNNNDAGASGASGGNSDLTGSVNDPINSITVAKYVSTNAGASLPQETFYLTMVPADDLTGSEKSGSNQVYAGPALNTPTVSVSFNSTDRTKTGSVKKTTTFDISAATGFKPTTTGEGEDATSVTFTHAGVYRYYIVESNEKGEALVEPTDKTKTHYITYDYSKYVVDLLVAMNDSNQYVVTNATVTKVGQEAKPAEIAFTNTISCSTIEISKSVVGQAYAADEAFTFYIMIPKAGDSITLDAGDTVQYQIYNEKDEPQGEAGTLACKGDTIESDVEANGNVFTLKDGWYMKITAPTSMIFKVQEADYTGEGYTTTAKYLEAGTYDKSTTLKNNDTTYQAAKVTNAENKEETIVCVQGTANTQGTQVVFTNSRTITAETGIYLDFLPYVLALVGALAAAGVWFFFRKRRTVR